MNIQKFNYSSYYRDKLIHESVVVMYNSIVPEKSKDPNKLWFPYIEERGYYNVTFDGLSKMLEPLTKDYKEVWKNQIKPLLEIKYNSYSFFDTKSGKESYGDRAKTVAQFLNIDLATFILFAQKENSRALDEWQKEVMEERGLYKKSEPFYKHGQLYRVCEECGAAFYSKENKSKCCITEREEKQNSEGKSK